jgi:hypothetical protein
MLACSYPACDCGAGKPPEGLEPSSVSATAVASVLGDMTRLEAASVSVFERRVREIETLGAPEALCDAARRAVPDESRHVPVVTGLAERAGAHVPQAYPATLDVRPLEAIATDARLELGVPSAAEAQALARWLRATWADPRRRRLPIGEGAVRAAALPDPSALAKCR